jgi:hypothetical protein
VVGEGENWLIEPTALSANARRECPVRLNDLALKSTQGSNRAANWRENCLLKFIREMPNAATHTYEVRARKDHRGVDLISDALPFGRLWYGEPGAINNTIGSAQFYSRSHDAVIRVYDEAGNVDLDGW